MRNDYREKQLKEWDDMLTHLFGGRIPLQCTWVKNTDIINVLQVIGKKPQSNHTFFPTGGGLDLAGADVSVELDCIELYFNVNGKSPDIVKPKVLIFQSFNAPYEWSYFRLETEKLEPSGVYDNLGGGKRGTNRNLSRKLCS